jgi:[protein-PII] uridylyltransferase
VTPAVPTEVRFDLDESSDATIVEVFARDRPGLLYAIVAALADAGLDISVSKIATEGEKVSDVFYVTAGGAKVTEPEALAAVAARVAAAIEAE